MNAIKKIKDKAYHYFAVKNYGVRREFPCYIKMNSKDPRWKRWIALIRLNWHYRIRREKFCAIIYDISHKGECIMLKKE